MIAWIVFLVLTTYGMHIIKEVTDEMNKENSIVSEEIRDLLISLLPDKKWKQWGFFIISSPFLGLFGVVVKVIRIFI